MTLSLAPMTAERAHEIAAWRYGDPFDADLAAARQERELVNGEHAAILDDGALVGFLVVGIATVVPGVELDGATHTDVLLGIRPDRRSERLGSRAGDLALEALQLGGHRSLRAIVRATDERALRLALRLGFTPAGTCTSDLDASTFAVLTRDLLD